jgi:hypothetical protein
LKERKKKKQDLGFPTEQQLHDPQKHMYLTLQGTADLNRLGVFFNRSGFFHTNQNKWSFCSLQNSLPLCPFQK